MAGYVNRIDASGDKPLLSSRWESLNDYAAFAAKSTRQWRDLPDSVACDTEFTGVPTPAAAVELAANGWQDPVPEALNVAADAVEKVEKLTEFDGFEAELSVSGCDVDIDRYLAGEPENMIEYPLRQVVKAGKVITLVASMSYSGSLSVDTIQRRGQAITALALALSRIGYSLEVWSDLTITSSSRNAQFRILLKAPGDPVDEARLMYALAHPSMLRVIGFGAEHGLPSEYKRAFRVGSGYGHPHDPFEDMPEGTIYLPCVRSDEDVPDADLQLLQWLKDLDLISE